MKKILSMMLLACSMLALTACSSDDDPTNPIANAVVPATAAIGSEVTVNGQGFDAAGVSLYLIDSSQQETSIDATLSANGATFTLPYTLTEGQYTIAVKHNAELWTLGTITLTAAANPIASLLLPDMMGIGDSVTIAGIGFTGDDKVVIAPTSAEAVTVGGSASADGLAIVVPATLPEGDCTVTLVRGASQWQVGTTHVYQPRLLESVTISEYPLLAMYGIDEAKFNFTYNADGSLKTITSEGMDIFQQLGANLNWEFAYSSNTVTTTGMYGNTITFTLDGSKRIIGCPSTNMYGDPISLDWTYNADGTLASITYEDEKDPMLVNTFVADNMTATTWGGEYLFGHSTDLAVPGTIDPGFLLNFVTYIVFGDESISLGMLLNQNVKTSKYIPNLVKVWGYDENGSDTWDEIAIRESFADNVLTLDTRNAATASGFYGSLVTAVYKNK